VIGGQASRRLYYAALVYLAVLGAAAIAAPLIAPHSPTEQHLRERLRPPSRTYPLGTDNLGRDLASRTLFGSRSAAAVGIVAVAISCVLGSLVGLIAALSVRAVDNLLMLLMDSLLSFPTVLLAITVVSFLATAWFR